MYTITEPLDEQDVLEVTSEETDAETIMDDMESNAQYCVDHLCGCST